MSSVLNTFRLKWLWDTIRCFVSGQELRTGLRDRNEDLKPSSIENCWCLGFGKGCWEAVDQMGRAGGQRGNWGPLTLKWWSEEAEKEQLETRSAGRRAARKGSVTGGCPADGACSDCCLSPLGSEEAKLAKSSPLGTLLTSTHLMKPSFEEMFPVLKKKVQKHCSR